MLKQNTATNVVLKLFASADHITPATGKTISVTVSKAGSAFDSISGTVSEISVGWYRVSLAAADLDTLGDLVVRGTASGCDPAERLLKVVAVDTEDATSFGLSRLDQSVGSRLAASDYDAAPSVNDVASAVWASGSRTLTGFGFSVTASTVTDKTGYSLSVAPPTAAQIRTELDANSTKLANLDTTISSRSTLTAAGVWTHTTRTLTSFGSLVSDIWTYAIRTLSGFTFPVVVHTNNDKTGYSLATAPPTAAEIRNEMDSNSTKLANLDQPVSSRLASASYSAPDNNGIAEIKAQTDKLQFTGTDLKATLDGESVSVSDKTGFSLTTTEHTSIADALLKRDWSQVTGEAARSVINALRAIRNKVTRSGNTLTVTKEDDTTSAWTAVVQTDGNALPVTGVDPE